MLSLAELQLAVEASWAADTSSVPDEWSPENPARGNCVPTALVVQLFLGGGLEKLQTEYRGKMEAHYRNFATYEGNLDLTRQQYPPSQEFAVTPVDLKGYASIREKRLHDPDTRRRYNILLGRVTSYLVEFA